MEATAEVNTLRAAQARRGGGSTPAVSVIIPAYNVAPFIAEALDSVFAQTFGDYEVIVVNDGSPDTEELERVLAPYRERIVYLKQENGGPSSARNTAIRAARAPLIAFLDGDDAWEPDYLAVQLALMADDPTIDVLYPNALIFGSPPFAGRAYMEQYASEGEVTFESLLLQRCHVVICCTARRDAIMRAGLFDESLRCSEDFDLWLRVLKGGGRIAYHRRVLARYRTRGGSASTDQSKMGLYLERVLDKAEQTMALTPAEQRAAEVLRERVRANVTFFEGKKAFFRGDVDDAIAKLTKANVYYKSRKIALVLRLLRIAPRLMLRLYHVRDRFVFKTDTKI